MKKIVSILIAVFFLIGPSVVLAQVSTMVDNPSFGDYFLYGWVYGDSQDNSQQYNPFNKNLVRSVSPTLPEEVTRTDHPAAFVQYIVRILFSFMGIGSVAYLVYGGYLYMTARDNQDTASQAKATIRNAVIGMILILTSYSIITFVTYQLLTASLFGAVRF